MRTFSTSYEYKYPWEQVSMAFWNRYPNPYATHVLSEDTVVRKIEDNGQLVSKRLITKKGSKVPKWGEMFLPAGRKMCVVEESIVDVENQTITTYTRNIGMTRVMLVEEKCVYRPSPTAEGHTICEREAFVTSGILGFGRALQAFGMDRFKKGAQKTVVGFEHVLGKMFMVNDSTEVVETAPQPQQPNKINVNAEKLKSTAHKAKEMAKSKAASVIVTN